MATGSGEAGQPSMAVMACDDEVVPLQDRIESVSDEADLEEGYNTERHLLYVACTRARDSLLVSSSGRASEFLSDLAGWRLRKDSGMAESGALFSMCPQSWSKCPRRCPLIVVDCLEQ